MAFDDFVERAEKLGAKKEVKVSYSFDLLALVDTLCCIICQSVVNRLRNGTTTLGDDDVLQDEEQAPTTGMERAKDNFNMVELVEIFTT